MVWFRQALKIYTFLLSDFSLSPKTRYLSKPVESIKLRFKNIYADAMQKRLVIYIWIS